MFVMSWRMRGMLFILAPCFLSSVLTTNDCWESTLHWTPYLILNLWISMKWPNCFMKWKKCWTKDNEILSFVEIIERLRNALIFESAHHIFCILINLNFRPSDISQIYYTPTFSFSRKIPIISKLLIKLSPHDSLATVTFCLCNILPEKSLLQTRTIRV